MRRYFIFITLLLCLTSCKWHYDYCHRCGQHLNCCSCNYYSCGTVSDVLTVNDLIGVWQSNYSIGYEQGLGFTPKMFNFVNHRYCDITYSVGTSTTWYTETFSYAYDGKYVKFSGNGKTFSFRIDYFLYPTLTVSDSHGKYEWYKRK